MLDTAELKEVRSNVTAIRLMSSSDVEAMNIVNQWKEKKRYFNAEQYRHAQNASFVISNRLKVSFFDYTCFPSLKKKHFNSS